MARSAKPQIRAEVTFYTNLKYNKRGELVRSIDAQVRYRDTRTGRLTKSVTGKGSSYIKDLTPEIAGALQRDLQKGRKTEAQVAGILGSYGTKNASTVAKQSARDSFMVAMSERFFMTDAQKNRITYLINKMDEDDFARFYKRYEHLISDMWKKYHARWEGKNKDGIHASEQDLQDMVKDIETSLLEYFETSKTSVNKQRKLEGFAYNDGKSIRFLRS